MDTENLRHLLETRYFRQNLRITDESTRRIYRYTLDNFEAALGRPATLADLSDENVEAMLSMLMAQGLSRATVDDRRKRISAFWRWLTAKKLADGLCTVPAVKSPARIPRAWTKEQLVALFDSCRLAPGRISGVRSRDWWRALHLCLWDSGERIAALLAAQWSDLDWTHGTLFIPAENRKGKSKDASYRLHNDTLAALVLVRGQQPKAERLMFPRTFVMSCFYRRYTTILKRAGLPTDRTCKPQKMRRSFASHLKAAGGDPTAALGHSTDAVTRKHYLDPSIAEKPQPPLFRIG